jgi:hypothetical protein
MGHQIDQCIEVSVLDGHVDESPFGRMQVGEHDKDL